VRVTFVAMGWENLSIESMSGYLKQHGHDVSLAYDQCLFDDKNYVSIQILQRLFNDPSSVIQQIIESKPDIVCFSVMSVMYNWALNLSHIVKEITDVPILFGGYHIIGSPNEVIKQNTVDMIIRGEGEIALLALCNAMEDKTWPCNIPGVWYKDDLGNVIDTGNALPLGDMDELPFFDKELFEQHVPIREYNLSSLARGCVYNCSYCAVTIQNSISKEAGIKMFRTYSVNRAIVELKYHKDKYNYKWVDFRHAIFSVDKEWTLEFCKQYKKEINVPFRIFMHPSIIKDETTKALVDAGCFTIQFGLESFDEQLRRKALNRHETNETIQEAINILERNKCSYTMDYILGLPGQTEEELKKVAILFSGLKYCYRLSPFMCQYLPGSEMVDYAVEIGELTAKDVEVINNGGHDNYMGEGSIAVFSKKRQRMLRMYRLIFRVMGLLPTWARKALLNSKIYLVFKYINPTVAIKFLDLAFIIFNRDARGYFKYYTWWISRRIIPSHPTFMFRKNPYKAYKKINLLTQDPDELMTNRSKR